MGNCKAIYCIILDIYVNARRRQSGIGDFGAAISFTYPRPVALGVMTVELYFCNVFTHLDVTVIGLNQINSHIYVVRKVEFFAIECS